MLIPRQNRVPSSRRRSMFRVAIPSFGLSVEKIDTPCIQTENVNRKQVLNLFGSDLEDRLNTEDLAPLQRLHRKAAK